MDSAIRCRLEQVTNVDDMPNVINMRSSIRSITLFLIFSVLSLIPFIIAYCVAVILIFISIGLLILPFVVICHVASIIKLWGIYIRPLPNKWINLTILFISLILLGCLNYKLNYQVAWGEHKNNLGMLIEFLNKVIPIRLLFQNH